MAENVSLEKISSEYFDVLKELGNIGAGNATTALAQLLNCKVNMMVPQVRLLGFDEVGEAMGGEEQIVLALYQGVEGDITGSIMFITDRTSGKILADTMLGSLSNPNYSEEMELSAVKEIANIITGAYLNSLSQLTNLTMYPSVPDLSVDMLNAILSVPAIEFGILGDQMLLIQTQFTDTIQVNGYFILLPDLESFARILTALGISV